jgi:hypothetical protein
MTRNKAKNNGDFISLLLDAKKVNISENIDANISIEQAKRMQNGYLFALFSLRSEIFFRNRRTLQNNKKNSFASFYRCH